MQKLVGLVFFLLGLGCLAAGWVYSGENGTVLSAAGDLHKQYFAPLDEFVRPLLRAIPDQAKPFILLESQGLLPIFVVLGLIIMGIAYFFATLEGKRTYVLDEKKRVAAVKQQATKSQPISVGSGSSSSESVSLDFSDDILAGVGEEESEEAGGLSEAEKQRVEKLVLLEQSEMSDDDHRELLEEYYPALMQFWDLFGDAETKEAISRQIIQSQRLYAKRQEAGITPHQFRIFETRAQNMERDTVGRRYMPKDLTKVPPHGKEIIGKAFSLAQQAVHQQRVLADSSEWLDFSLVNAAEVLATSLEPEPTPSGSGTNQPA